MTSQHPPLSESSHAGRTHTRRVVLGSAAWVAPAIVVASAAPAFAASGLGSITVVSTRGTTAPGVGSVLVRLDPDPGATQTPTAVATYDDLGARTTDFVREGASGAGGLYRLTFTTTTRPVPPSIEARITVAPFGTAVATVTMAAPGTVDTTFADADLSHQGEAVAIRPDGMVLVAGRFTQVAGVSQKYVARFSTTGVEDSSYADPAINNFVNCLALQADGKAVIGGNFTRIGGSPFYGYLGRLTADGALDTSFADPDLQQLVYGVGLQSTGKIVATGYFTDAGGDARKYLARFNTDGTLDPTFADPNLGAAAGQLAYGFAVVVLPDDKIVVAGDFTTVDGVTRNKLARLNADGTLDATFADPGLDGRTLALTVQSDGKVLAGGESTSAGGQTRSHLARFNADGTLDTTFVDPALNDRVRGIVVQPDGRIIVSGGFTTVGGEARSRLARLTATGSLDTSFADAGLDAQAIGLALQGDGKVVVTGGFTTAGGATRKRLARFHT